MKKILITSALPYANNIPHLGTLIGCVLSADVFARFCRSRGYECLYICGTDEYGTATETKALEEGVTPREICDRYYPIHKESYDWFNISFDYFGRTSTEAHTRIVQDIFQKLYQKGYIFPEDVEQFYCEHDKRFLADRYVEGICPFCGFEDARGDQCDNCGKLLDPTELINPRCKICGNTPTIKTSRHLFLNLPKLKDELDVWIDRAQKNCHWSHNSYTVTKAWMRDGLKPRAITRDLKWGIPVPLEGFENKVFYVWFDAPIGYISITADYTEGWESWWKKPDSVYLYQFMAKDNIPFHTVVFPSTLLGTHEAYTLPYHINATEYLNYEEGKFSKSRNLGVFANQAKETGIPSDMWRYYLLINRPEKSDTTFRWNDFMDKVNNELIANIGNLVNRVIHFTQHFADSVTPEYELTEQDQAFLNKVASQTKIITQYLENVELKDALKAIMHTSKLANQYFQASQPWKTIKDNPQQAKTSLYVLINFLKDLAILVHPYLPQTSENICSQLKITLPSWDDLNTQSIRPGHKLGISKRLYHKLEEDRIEELRKRFSGKKNKISDDITKFDFRVAKIMHVRNHPNADKLYVIDIDFGTERRTLVAGLKSYYTEEELIGRKVIVIANLQPANIRGVTSKGMMLAAEDAFGTVELLGTESDPGTAVHFTDAKPVEQVTIKEFSDLSITVNSNHIVTYKNMQFRADDKLIIAKKVAPGAKVR